MSEVEDSQNTIGPVECPHCGNVTPMQIVSTYSQVKEYSDSQFPIIWDAGNVYELLACASCHRVTLRSYFYHSHALEPDEIEIRILYPAKRDAPSGLPDQISKAYSAANRVKAIDANAYGVLLRRVLELVCVDREASGKDLNAKLADLAQKGEIPSKLAGVAKGLRQLGNVGAHATLGELTPEEVPVLDDLCRAILEYVYSAPSLAQCAEERLNRLKASKAK
ncbi:MAG TPA: DUF4145 domain-containing protein [Thermoanaerobaculia bacterium]|jgi:hypothetical protein|nr:DUF4145 domain-containing protein [Thermoanaerobaculia bacterium]